MTGIPDTPTLAMPIGLSPDAATRETHYQDLAAKLVAEIQSDMSVRIWTDPALLYSTISPMVRTAAKFYLAGSAGPGGGMLATNTVIFSTWLWEYLSLRKGGGASVAAPALIRIGNIDQDQLQTAVQAELNANVRYASWTQTEKTQFVTDFLAGSAFMLVDAGTKFGAGTVDPSPLSSAPPGDRRIDFAFLKPDGTILDSPLYFEMWGLIGGENVKDHPLLDAVARDITPGTAPIEGGTRIRAIGHDFTDQTTVTVGDNAATNLFVPPDGQTIYFDVPSGAEGTADVVIDTPAQPLKTIVAGMRYVTDLTETVRASVRSLEIKLAEIKISIDVAVANGTIDDSRRLQAILDLDSGFRNHQKAMVLRQQETGTPLHSTGIITALMEQETVINSLVDKLYDSIFSGAVV